MPKFTNCLGGEEDRITGNKVDLLPRPMMSHEIKGKKFLLPYKASRAVPPSDTNEVSSDPVRMGCSMYPVSVKPDEGLSPTLLRGSEDPSIQSQG